MKLFYIKDVSTQHEKRVICKFGDFVYYGIGISKLEIQLIIGGIASVFLAAAYGFILGV